MNLETLLENVKPQWKNEFVRFVETGEAGEGFLTYLNQDSNAQQAVETAFQAQASAFENLAEELKRATPAQGVEVMVGQAKPVETVSAKVAEAVKDVSHLSPDERREAVAKALSNLKTSLDGNALAIARTVANTLAKDL